MEPFSMKEWKRALDRFRYNEAQWRAIDEEYADLSNWCDVLADAYASMKGQPDRRVALEIIGSFAGIRVPHRVSSEDVRPDPYQDPAGAYLHDQYLLLQRITKPSLWANDHIYSMHLWMKVAVDWVNWINEQNHKHNLT